MADLSQRVGVNTSQLSLATTGAGEETRRVYRFMFQRGSARLCPPDLEDWPDNRPIYPLATTFEGAIAGIVGVVIWILVSSHWQGSFAADLMGRWGLLITIALSVLLAVFSICGDLFESMLKRRAGVKDSSQLLPGHGGFYDRIDAVVAVVPLAYLLTEGLKF